MKHLRFVFLMTFMLGLALTAPSLYAQADLPLVLQDLHNPSSKIGITQNQVGGTATMELLTNDGSGNLATRLLLRGDSDFHNIEFYRGARGSETLTMMVRGSDGRVGIGTDAPSSLLHVEGNIQAGSTMQTGIIRHYRNGFAQEAGILWSDVRGGILHLRDESGNNHTLLQPDFDGEGGVLSVRRNTASAGFRVDGNFNGTEATRVTIFGTSNMSFNASEAGDASVELPSDAVSSVEILDETGATQDLDNFSTALTGGGTLDILVSSTITAPSSGHVLAIGSGRIRAIHTSGTSDDANFGVTADCDAAPSLPAAQDNDFFIPSGASTGNWDVPFSAQHIFEVSAGSNTFCIVAEEVSGSLETADETLSLIFIPTAYGSVAQSGPETAGDDESAGSARLGGLTQAEIAREQAVSMAANQVRIGREMAEIQARIEELERYLEQVGREQSTRQGN